jgi:hypothetical protein
MKPLPPVEFTYEQPGWNTAIHTLPAAANDNLPIGIDDNMYQWVDLYNEGMSGIFTEQSGAWYYKSNAGNGQLDGLQLVAARPSHEGITTGHLHFQDLEGNGKKYLVSDNLEGYYEFREDGNEWQPFRPFARIPNINLHDPNLKFLDLNGDGMADILVSEEQVFTWYASKGTQGFESHQKTRHSLCRQHPINCTGRYERPWAHGYCPNPKQ